MNKEDRYLLDFIAGLLPLFPPLTEDGKDASIKDLYPNLTDDELNYVFKKYKGTMRLQ